MITLALTIIGVCVLVLAPALAWARYDEWRIWDFERRVARLRARRGAS